MSMKDIVEKAKSYEDLIESLKYQPIQAYREEDSHLKGYLIVQYIVINQQENKLCSMNFILQNKVVVATNQL